MQMGSYPHVPQNKQEPTSEQTLFWSQVPRLVSTGVTRYSLALLAHDLKGACNMSRKTASFFSLRVNGAVDTRNTDDCDSRVHTQRNGSLVAMSHTGKQGCRPKESITLDTDAGDQMGSYHRGRSVCRTWGWSTCASAYAGRPVRWYVGTN